MAMLRIPFGDLVLVAGAEIPGLHPAPPPRLIWEIGPVRDTIPADRTAGLPPVYKYPPDIGKVAGFMILQADKKAPFALKGFDEVGNQVPVAAVFAVDDPSIVALTDNGDGTGEIAATGVLGVAQLTGTVTLPDGSTTSTVEAINVQAGDVESFAFEFGEPVEVTPDEPTEPETPTEPEPTPEG